MALKRTSNVQKLMKASNEKDTTIAKHTRELAEALRRAKAAEARADNATPNLKSMIAEGLADFIKNQRMADRAGQSADREADHQAKPGNKRAMAEAGTSARPSPTATSPPKATPTSKTPKADRKRAAKGKESATAAV